jgi:hypothetical protein
VRGEVGESETTKKQIGTQKANTYLKTTETQRDTERETRLDTQLIYPPTPKNQSQSFQNSRRFLTSRWIPSRDSERTKVPVPDTPINKSPTSSRLIALNTESGAHRSAHACPRARGIMIELVVLSDQG